MKNILPSLIKYGVIKRGTLNLKSHFVQPWPHLVSSQVTHPPLKNVRTGFRVRAFHRKISLPLCARTRSIGPCVPDLDKSLGQWWGIYWVAFRFQSSSCFPDFVPRPGSLVRELQGVSRISVPMAPWAIFFLHEPAWTTSHTVQYNTIFSQEAPH